MRTYQHDPALFDDCDPHRIPYGEPGYDPFLDVALPRLQAKDLLDPANLAVRQAILDGRVKRHRYGKRLDSLRDDSRRIKDVLVRRA